MLYNLCNLSHTVYLEFKKTVLFNYFLKSHLIESECINNHLLKSV